MASELTVPQINFSSLGQLGNVYREGQKRQQLSDLGRGLADGTLDYRQAASQTANMGDITHTLQFLALAEAQKKQGLEQQASADFNKGVGGMFGAQPAPASSMPNSMPVPGAAPPSAAPRAPVQASSRVWGGQEAENAGLYEPSAKPMTLAALGSPSPLDNAEWPAGPVGAPSRAAPQAQAPAVTAQAGQVGAQHVPALIGALSNPNLPAGQKETAKLLLTEAFKNSKKPERIQLLEAFKDNPELLRVEMELAKAKGTTVNVGGEKEFDKELDKGQAKRWNGYIEEGQAAERKLVDINTMREIHQRIGSQGAAANIKEAIGPYAEALGINVAGLSDIQAYSQVIQRIAPQQRAPGSGSTSDIEFKGFLKSLPPLSQNPAAREMGLNTMEALTRDDMARGEIASRLATREITRVQAEKALRDLPDPMRGFVEWRKANPEIYGQALKGGAAPASAPQDNGARIVPSTKVEIDQSLANAKAAIAKNPAARDAIIKKVRDAGLDTSGL